VPAHHALKLVGHGGAAITRRSDARVSDGSRGRVTLTLPIVDAAAPERVPEKTRAELGREGLAGAYRVVGERAVNPLGAEIEQLADALALALLADGDDRVISRGVGGADLVGRHARGVSSQAMPARAASKHSAVHSCMAPTATVTASGAGGAGAGGGAGGGGAATRVVGGGGKAPLARGGAGHAASCCRRRASRRRARLPGMTSASWCSSLMR